MRLLPLAIVAALSGCHPSHARTVQITVADVRLRDLTAKWITTLDDEDTVLFLKQDGDRVSGIYAGTQPQPETTAGGTLEGRLVGNELPPSGRWRT